MNPLVQVVISVLFAEWWLEEKEKRRGGGGGGAYMLPRRKTPDRAIF